jgi:hypothetical protein
MSNRNAKLELLSELSNSLIIKCATIRHKNKTVNLKIGYSNEDFQLVLEELDFEYDAGYGGQELFGTIWFTDGTWSDRGEYDGSEWWEHMEMPPIPINLH